MHSGQSQRLGHQIRLPGAAAGFERVDSWFSYGPAEKGRSPLSPLPELAPLNGERVHFGEVEEEIVVIGERQRRQFARMKPDDELTGPRALDAFQPFVPLPGATCTYKTLCYDLSQPPLRETLPKLAALLFGD